MGGVRAGRTAGVSHRHRPRRFADVPRSRRVRAHSPQSWRRSRRWTALRSPATRSTTRSSSPRLCPAGWEPCHRPGCSGRSLRQRDHDDSRSRHRRRDRALGDLAGRGGRGPGDHLRADRRRAGRSSAAPATSRSPAVAPAPRQSEVRAWATLWRSSSHDRSTPEARGALGDLTSEDVARLDAAAADCGVSTLQLMEIAGWQVARCAWRRLGGRRSVERCRRVWQQRRRRAGRRAASRHLGMRGTGARPRRGGARDRGRRATTCMSARRCGVDVIVEADPRRCIAWLRWVRAGHRCPPWHRVAAARPASPRRARSARSMSRGPGPERRRAQRSRRHDRRGVRPDRPRGADLHAHRHEARICDRGDAVALRRRGLGRRHRHARDGVAPSRACSDHSGVTGGELVHTSS